MGECSAAVGSENGSSALCFFPVGIVGSRTGGPVDSRALGLAAGVLWAVTVAVLELTAHTEYGERWRMLLEDIYPWYDREPGDLLWGPTVGFVDAFAFGELYNRFAT